MTLRERLEAAIGPCTIPGGRELHLELVLAAVKDPGTPSPSLAAGGVPAAEASQVPQVAA